MSNTERKGDWQQTFTGKQFWPCDPRPEDVCLEDIAHALSLQCRFAGHCREFYSVAEHSVRVSWLIEAWNVREGYAGAWRFTSCLAALLHDASEAYCIDVPRPLKPYLAGYKAIEAGVMSALERWAGLNPGACSVPAIKHADEVLLRTEARDLMSAPPVPWTFAQGAPAEPLPDVIRPMSPEFAKGLFIDRFNELKGRM